MKQFFCRSANTNWTLTVSIFPTVITRLRFKMKHYSYFSHHSTNTTVWETLNLLFYYFTCVKNTQHALIFNYRMWTSPKVAETFFKIFLEGTRVLPATAFSASRLTTSLPHVMSLISQELHLGKVSVFVTTDIQWTFMQKIYHVCQVCLVQKFIFA